VILDFTDGVLPDGIHICTLEEVVERFGRFQGSDRRPRLTQALVRYIQEVRNVGIAAAIIIDGSYVTMKAKPNDIDMILVLRHDAGLSLELTPVEYRVQSVRMVQKAYGFDILVAVANSRRYLERLGLFSQVRTDDPGLRTSGKTKGLLRINL